MATIRRYVGKRGTTFVLCWHADGQEHRRSLGKVTYQEAERFRKIKDHDLAIGRFQHFAPSFDEFSDRYIDWHAAQYPDSHARVRQVIRQYLSPHFGTKALDEITPEHVEQYKSIRLNADPPPAPTTVAKEMRVLQALMNRAVALKELQANPIASVLPPRDTRDAPPPYYSRSQLATLYKASDEVHRAIWRLFVNTGMRRAEGMALKWDNVKADGIYLVSTAESRTKSGRWRMVPRTPTVNGALRVLRELDRDSLHVLPRMFRESLSRAFSLAAERAGIPGSLHWLRHTYASHLVMAGTPLRTVQALLGHATIATTEKYAHLSADHLAQVARLRL